MREELLREIQEVVGQEWAITARSQIEGYLADETSNLVRPKPAEDIVVVKPRSTEEVARILRIANMHGIPVFPRGGGTGLVGGAVPVTNGIVLALERMNGMDVDKENLMVVAEAGATLEKLIDAAERDGLAFPPHPGDEGAQVGGLIACNAGGSRALKHGVMRSFVKGLEVVLPSGEVLSLGGKLLKDNSGYSLMHLMIGSEGTLAVITKATMRLTTKFESSLTLIVPFISRHGALNAVPEILQQGVTPLALEYVERELVQRSAEHIGAKWPAEGEFFLVFILAGEEADVYVEAQTVSEICQGHASAEPLVADRRDEQSSILKVRSSIYTALKGETLDILDTTVPPNSIGKLADEIDAIALEYQTYLPLYGHAGDGNLHCHIMRKDLARYDSIKNRIYETCRELGGVITGEHGIGKLRVLELERSIPHSQLALMRAIKSMFDPNNILNPSTVLAQVARATTQDSTRTPA